MKARASRRPQIVLWLAVVCLAVGLTRPWSLLAQGPQVSSDVQLAAIAESDVREWLTYLSSDALQGRQVFTEGYGLAAAYVAEELRKAGVKPLGDFGYFQTVKRVGYAVTQNSTVSVTVNGQTRTFRHREHVTFPASGGARQTPSYNGVEVVGYGMVNLAAKHDDFKGRDVRGKLAVWMPGTPAALGQGGGRGRSRSPFIVETYGPGAVMTFAPAPAPPSPEVVAAQAAVEQATQALSDAQAQLQQARATAAGRGGGRGGGRGAGRGGGGAVQPNLITVQRVDLLVTPQFTADEEFFAFLFSAAPVTFEAYRAKAEAGEPLDTFTIPNVTVTIDVNNTYDVVSTELTKNVVGMVEGSDPALKDTYVLFGSHLDHTGYRPSAAAGRGGGGGAQPDSSEPPDLINNGADDDGSGSTGLLGIAKAFATGPKPKRSVVFVWHAGEEAGLLGSRYMADHPVVPIEQVQAQLNIDMIGRNRDDDPEQSNTVFVIGADRISTDLHNLLVDSNQTMAQPLTLDYEYNDPSDRNSFYTRSDHYSYAAKGIPIAFFFTGTHPDYHRASDEVDKILFPKLTRIAQLVYQAGFHVANSAEPLERDNLGPRAGVGFAGRIDR
jgi:Zn-dependent M28 family amino/carboxypeptidase